VAGVLALLLCSGIASAANDRAGWWSNSCNGNYLRVNERIFTSQLPLTGEWTLFTPASRSGSLDIAQNHRLVTAALLEIG
jgi:hypothetical protein